MKKKIVLMMVAAMALLVAGCGIGKLKGDGNAFMEAMKSGDPEKSYPLLDESLQKELGDIDGWKKWSAKRKPISWNFSGFNINAAGTGDLSGEAEFTGNIKATVTLKLVKVGEDYKVIGITFKEHKS